MFRLLTRVPVDSQKSIAGWLVGAAVLISLFGLLFFIGFTEKTKDEGHLWWKKTEEIPLSDRLPYLFGALGLLAVAGLFIAVALVLITSHGRLKKYPPILTGVESIKLQQIATITGSSPSRVCQDIQTLIDAGIVSDFYIDYGAEQVVSRKYIPERSHKTVVTCSGCGGNNEVIVGITRTCGFCGEPLILRAT